MSDRPSEARAIRALVTGMVQSVGFRDGTRRRAIQLGVTGWVRNTDDGDVAVHAEGQSAAIDALVAFLRTGPRGAVVDEVSVDEVRLEGHEQFAIRGVSAGRFLIHRHAAPSSWFELRLEVAGAMRSWTLPKCPSLDPSVKRFAIQAPDHPIDRDAVEGRTGDGEAMVWDRGYYEQGGRVPWPEALERGHAVFVLHGDKLRGGFALQRIRPGPNPQWLLVKRRDEHARSGSDIVGELSN